MTRILPVVFLLMGSPLFGQTAPTPLPCDAEVAAKGDDAYRVVTNRVVYLNCVRTDLLQLETTGQLFEGTGSDRAPVKGVTASAKLYQENDSWIRVEFQSAAAAHALEKGKDYELDLAPDQAANVTLAVDGKPAQVMGPFKKLKVTFSTKPAAVIRGGRASSLGSTFEVYSSLVLENFQKDEPRLIEVNSDGTKVVHEAETIAKGATLPPSREEGSHLEPRPFGDNPETFGRAAMTLTRDHLRRAKVTLEVENLRNCFGDTLVVHNEVALDSVPKTKDDARWYVKFDHQMSADSKPGYAIETKLSPQLGPPGPWGLSWQPALNMDIGAGTVNNVKVNDTIIPSLGLTRLYRYDNQGLQALRETTALSFETNKEFNKANVVVDQDFQFFVGPLESPRLVRAWDNYNVRKKDPKEKDLKFSSEMADWGAGIRLYAGLELGRAIMTQDVKAANSSDTVSVPVYSVARIRPKIAAYAEYKTTSLSVSFLPRYLLTTEYATRQPSDGKTITLYPVSGFQLYGEASLSIGLDEGGHVALSSTYKRGCQPPTFQSANTVQTGILLRY
jgi:hypothetical protein